jgi:hypothetical protein
MSFELWDWLIHVFLIPLYLILGTGRHEYSHVLSAQLEGVKVRYVLCLPHWGAFLWDGFGYAYVHRFRPEEGLKFRFGVWVWGDGKEPNWVTHLMPYLVDVMFICVGMYVAPRVLHYQGEQGWLTAVILFWVSPSFDLLYNLWKWLVHKRGDWEKVFPHGRD